MGISTEGIGPHLPVVFDNAFVEHVADGTHRPRRVSQAAQPVPAVGEAIYWHDSVNAKVYLVYNDPTLGVKKVELL